MKALAQFIMKGRMQALGAFTGLLLVSYLFPVLSVLALACLSLVTLRHGVKEGLFLLPMLLIVAGAMGGLGSPDGQGLWLNLVLIAGAAIVVLLSAILRASRSLALTVLVAGIVAIAANAVLQFQAGDTSNIWQEYEAMQPFLQELTAEMEPEQYQVFEQSMDNVFATLVGSILRLFLLYVIASVLLARWWQAMLYNPGGFQQEFHQLALDRRFAIFSVIVLVATFALSGMAQILAKNLLVVISGVYLLQGLAVAHCVVAIKKLQTAWLVAAYIMVFIASEVLAAAGFLDTWFKFRERAQVKPPAA